MDEVTKVEGAISALDNMRRIVINEALIQGKYVTDFVIDQQREAEDAICGGRNFCAVGALWMGAGVAVKTTEGLELPGIDYDEDNETRLNYCSENDRWDVWLAYELLNQHAAVVAGEHHFHLASHYRDSMLEAMFESPDFDPELLEHREILLEVIARARREAAQMLAPLGA